LSEREPIEIGSMFDLGHSHRGVRCEYPSEPNRISRKETKAWREGLARVESPGPPLGIRAKGRGMHEAPVHRSACEPIEVIVEKTPQDRLVVVVGPGAEHPLEWRRSRHLGCHSSDGLDTPSVVVETHPQSHPTAGRVPRAIRSGKPHVEHRPHLEHKPHISSLNVMN
jgi:hypothetical protein